MSGVEEDTIVRLLSTWWLTRASFPFPPLPFSSLKPLARLFKMEVLNLASEVIHRYSLWEKTATFTFPQEQRTPPLMQMSVISSEEQQLLYQCFFLTSVALIVPTVRQVSLAVQRLPGSCMESRPYRYFDLVLKILLFKDIGIETGCWHLSSKRRIQFCRGPQNREMEWTSTVSQCGRGVTHSYSNVRNNFIH